MNTQIGTSLFDNVSNDVCNLFPGGNLDGRRVVNFLNYKNEDVSASTGVPLKSIRYDSRMPAELHDRLMEWAVAINLVGNYFQDSNKTMLWFQTPNHLLGTMAPKDFIRLGRFKRLMKFINTALDENARSF